MKKSTLFTFVAVSFLAVGCSFSVGTNKDLSTGLSYSYNGFTVNDVRLLDADNLPYKSNEVEVGRKVTVSIEGLANYVLKDEKAFPGLSMSVTDKAGAEILGFKDYFENTEGYTATDAAYLRGFLTIGNPMVSGETYHVKVRAWDKNKAENELTAEVDLVVK